MKNDLKFQTKPFDLTKDQINLLAKGLKFIPTPVTNEKQMQLQLLRDFENFARRMRLRYMFHGKDKEPHPFHVKSTWKPPIQRSVALESYLGEVTNTNQKPNPQSQNIICQQPNKRHPRP